MPSLLKGTVSLKTLREEGGREQIPMSEENKAVARRVVEKLFNHDGNLDAADQLFAPNYLGHTPPFGDLHGTEAVKQFAATERQAFPDPQNTIEDHVAEGDKVVTFYSVPAA
jgi:predicted SnoaL-like aldol condensation-catalyzing enzyme